MWGWHVPRPSRAACRAHWNLKELTEGVALAGATLLRRWDHQLLCVSAGRRIPFPVGPRRCAANGRTTWSSFPANSGRWRNRRFPSRSRRRKSFGVETDRTLVLSPHAQGNREDDDVPPLEPPDPFGFTSPGTAGGRPTAPPPPVGSFPTPRPVAKPRESLPNRPAVPKDPFDDL